MFSEQRWTPIHAPRGPIEKIWRTGIAEAAPELGMLDLCEKTARRKLLVFEQRLGTAHDRIWLAKQLRALEEIVAVVVRDPFIEHVEKMLCVDRSIHHVVPLRLDEILRLAIAVDPFDERRPIAQRAMHDVAVAAFADPK